MPQGICWICGNLWDTFWANSKRWFLFLYFFHVRFEILAAQSRSLIFSWYANNIMDIKQKDEPIFCRSWSAERQRSQILMKKSGQIFPGLALTVDRNPKSFGVGDVWQFCDIRFVSIKPSFLIFSNYFSNEIWTSSDNFLSSRLESLFLDNFVVP